MKRIVIIIIKIVCLIAVRQVQVELCCCICFAPPPADGFWLSLLSPLSELPELLPFEHDMNNAAATRAAIVIAVFFIFCKLLSKIVLIYENLNFHQS